MKRLIKLFFSENMCSLQICGEDEKPVALFSFFLVSDNQPQIGVWLDKQHWSFEDFQLWLSENNQRIIEVMKPVSKFSVVIFQRIVKKNNKFSEATSNKVKLTKFPQWCLFTNCECS